MNIHETYNQWISCRDVMPREDGWYDVWLYKNDPHMDCGEGRHTDVRFVDGEFLWSDDKPIAFVTHWMKVAGPSGNPVDSRLEPKA